MQTLQDEMNLKKYKITCQFNTLSTRDKNTEFANSVDLDEVAHNEP